MSPSTFCPIAPDDEQPPLEIWTTDHAFVMRRCRKNGGRIVSLATVDDLNEAEAEWLWHRLRDWTVDRKVARGETGVVKP